MTDDPNGSPALPPMPEPAVGSPAARTWRPVEFVRDGLLALGAWSQPYRHIWFQALLCIAVIWALLTLSPAVDVMRTLSEGDGKKWDFAFSSPEQWRVFGNWTFLWLACLFSGVTLWYWPAVLYKFTPDFRPKGRDPWAFIWIRRAFGLMPFTLAIVAILAANRWSIALSFDAGTISLVVGDLLLLLFFVARRCFVSSPGDFSEPAEGQPAGRRDMCTRITGLVGKRKAPQKSWINHLYQRLGGADTPWITRVEGRFIVGTLGFSILMLLLFYWVVPGTAVAELLGSPALLFFAIGIIIPGVSLLIWLSRPAGVALLPVLLALLFGASFFNDTHDIQLMPGRAATRPTLDEMWGRWSALHEKDDGPVIIVASPGGASRAAYWTGSVMAGLDRATKGRFSDHVFAISSVSGGSLGAYDYAAFLKVAQQNCGVAPKPLGFVQNVLGADYLSPVIAGMFYPDLLQRFSPFPLFPSRGHFLEQAFRRGWDTRIDAALEDAGCSRNARAPSPDSLLAKDYASLWTDVGKEMGNGKVRTPWIPLVFANSTHDESGRRVIFSPVRMVRGGQAQGFSDLFLNAYDFYDDFGRGQPIDAASAIHNSARFPIVSPAGRLPTGQGHLVDGGYFDSSGLITAYDLARYIDGQLGLGKAPGKQRQIFIVDIDNTDTAPATDIDRFQNGKEWLDPPTRIDCADIPHNGPAFFELGLIGKGFLGTWVSRQYFEAKRLSFFANKVAGSRITYVRLGLPLPPGEQAVTLNWALSSKMRQRMDKEGLPHNLWAHSTKAANDNFAKLIWGLVKPVKMETVPAERAVD